MSKSNITVKLTGTDGNAFAVIGLVSKSLKREGQADLAKQFTAEAFACKSYDALLRKAMEYVEVE